MKLYYHKTDGGAEYLTDKFTLCLNGHKEGILEGAKYIVRIDGDIEHDAELTFSGEADQNVIVEALKALNQKAKSLNNLQHAGVEIDPALWNDLYQTSAQVDALVNEIQNQG